MAWEYALGQTARDIQPVLLDRMKQRRDEERVRPYDDILAEIQRLRTDPSADQEQVRQLAVQLLRSPSTFHQGLATTVIDEIRQEQQGEKQQASVAGLLGGGRAIPARPASELPEPQAPAQRGGFVDLRGTPSVSGLTVPKLPFDATRGKIARSDGPLQFNADEFVPRTAPSYDSFAQLAASGRGGQQALVETAGLNPLEVTRLAESYQQQQAAELKALVDQARAGQMPTPGQWMQNIASISELAKANRPAAVAALALTYLNVVGRAPAAWEAEGILGEPEKSFEPNAEIYKFYSAALNAKLRNPFGGIRDSTIASTFSDFIDMMRVTHPASFPNHSTEFDPRQPLAGPLEQRAEAIAAQIKTEGVDDSPTLAKVTAGLAGNSWAGAPLTPESYQLLRRAIALAVGSRDSEADPGRALLDQILQGLGGQ